MSGVARSGKNLFCSLASEIFEKKFGVSTKTYSLAYTLKRECEKYVKDTYELNVFSEITEEKEKFRDYLVSYADVKRKQTNGKYFHEILEKEISKDLDSDVIFISDIRFFEYPTDEVPWLLDTMRGTLIHVSKYKYDNNLNKVFYPPANVTEAFNDPLVKSCANKIVKWQNAAEISDLRNIVYDTIFDLTKRNL